MHQMLGGVATLKVGEVERHRQQDTARNVRENNKGGRPRVTASGKTGNASIQLLVEAQILHTRRRPTRPPFRLSSRVDARCGGGRAQTEDSRERLEVEP